MLTSSHWLKTKTKQKRRKRRRKDVVLNETVTGLKKEKKRVDVVLNETQAIRPKEGGDAAPWLNVDSGVLLMMQAQLPSATWDVSTRVNSQCRFS